MASLIPKGRTIDGLREVWSSIDELVVGLTDDQWRLPSPLPGWDVQANMVHVLGTEAFLSGAQPSSVIDPDAIDHVRNEIGAFNEAWVMSFADVLPTDVLGRFRELTALRLAALDEMSQEEWDTVGFTPAGQDAYGRFMQIRVFDCWMHEQDIRVAVGRPGHETGVAVEISLDEMTRAMGFVVGKRAGVPAGSSVTFELTGDSARTIHVSVGERAAVVPALDGPATTTITLPVVSFSRIAGGRLDADDHRASATVMGDDELGRRVLENLSYTI